MIHTPFGLVASPASVRKSRSTVIPVPTLSCEMSEREKHTDIEGVPSATVVSVTSTSAVNAACKG